MWDYDLGKSNDFIGELTPQTCQQLIISGAFGITDQLACWLSKQFNNVEPTADVDILRSSQLSAIIPVQHSVLFVEFGCQKGVNDISAENCL